MRELEADPEWVAKRDERERRRQERSRFYAADEAELVAELRDLGYAVESVWDLVNNDPHPILERVFVGPYQSAYPLLVRHLRVAHVSRTREGIIRALSVSDVDSATQSALLQELKNESNPELRWTLANALQASLSSSEQARHPEIALALRWPGPDSGAA